MSAEFNFTDFQWYNFICGFHAGLKLKDLTMPPYETNITLHPIGVGGFGQIGLALPEVLYNPTESDYKIPVFTHDVDIDYSGFSVNIKWDSTRLHFNGVEAGEFGTVGDARSSADVRYSYSKGNLKAFGLKDKTVKFKEPLILFYINVTVVGDVTEDDPIPLSFQNNSLTDINYCTLLKWVEVSPGSWFNFFITPLMNVSGAIVSLIKKKQTPLGDVTTIAARAVSSGVYVGSSFTAPGSRGVVPVVSCSNVADEYPYDVVHCKIVVADKYNIFKYLDVVGCGGFIVSTTSNLRPDGFMELDITAVRNSALVDSITFCYIMYEITDEMPAYEIPLYNVFSQLGNSIDKLPLLDVQTFDGLIRWPGGGIGWGYKVSFGGGGSGGGGGGFGGGIGGSGSVWSDSRQIIWIQAGDGPRYPVYLEPGWNEISFWIPYIFPVDTWIQVPLIIDAPGYILIPAGFEWEILTSPDAPEKLGNRKMSDKLIFVDLYDVDLQEVTKPIDVDNITESFTFEDVSDNNVINTHSVDTSLIEDLTVEDLHQIELVLPPFSGESNNIEKSTFSDFLDSKLIRTHSVATSSADELAVDDFHDIDIKLPPFTGEVKLTEKTDIVDVNSNDHVKTNKKDTLENEAMGFSDVYLVDLE